MIDVKQSARSEWEFELISRTLAGETQCFEELLQPYVPGLLKFARRALRNHADSEDVVQEAMTKAFTKLYQFRGTAKFSTWLYRITLNEIRQHRRSLPLRHELPLTVSQEWLVSQDLHPAAIAEREGMRDAVKGTLSGLPAKMRNALILYHIEEIPLSDAARDLGVHNGALKTTLFRARRRMRKAWQSRYGLWGSQYPAQVA